MTKEELLKLGLTEEQADKVLVAHTEATKDFVPKKDLDTAKETIKERDGQLETLKNADGTSKKLQAEIEKLQGENAVNANERDIDLAIAYAGAASPKAAQALKSMLGINPAEAKRDKDGAIIGLAEGIKSLQGDEVGKNLFASTTFKFKGAEPGQGKEFTPPGDDNSGKEAIEFAKGLAASSSTQTAGDDHYFKQ